MNFVIGWITLSLIIGYIGSTRKIGFFSAFLLSLLLSPVIGALIAFNSKSHDRQRFEDDLLDQVSGGGRSSAREQQKADRWNQALEKHSQGRLTDAELEIERQRIFGR